MSYHVKLEITNLNKGRTVLYEQEELVDREDIENHLRYWGSCIESGDCAFDEDDDLDVPVIFCGENS